MPYRCLYEWPYQQLTIKLFSFNQANGIKKSFKEIGVVLILTSLITLFYFSSTAQLSAEKINNCLNNVNLPGLGLRYTLQVKELYAIHSFQPFWLNQNRQLLESLINQIEKSAEYGLEKDDYQYPTIRQLNSPHHSLRNEKDSLIAEIRCTDAAIHFLHDIHSGNSLEPLKYAGLKYSGDCSKNLERIHQYLASKKMEALVDPTEPKDSSYIKLKFELNRLLKFDSSKNLIGHSFSHRSVNHQNTLNRKKIDALKRTMNFIRWLENFRYESNVLLINIPSASLMVFEKGNPVIESKIIVGKRSTPTPTLSSKISEIILYPYWNVPHKIASRELLPRIRRNKNYLRANNYQILNNSNQVVSPENINWHTLGPNHFPYRLRQKTGCDNSLGLFKLNFYNPFSVYLHDTPGKNLFNQTKRFFSHGCMRVQKAKEITRFLLKNNTALFDQLIAKGCLENQLPIVIPIKENIPVIVVYHTAWFDLKGNPSFFEDVYGKFKSSSR